jgi:hypothetical protein
MTTAPMMARSDYESAASANWNIRCILLLCIMMPWACATEAPDLQSMRKMTYVIHTTTTAAQGCLGSGFSIGEELVATNAHVVLGANRIMVKDSEGREIVAQGIVHFDQIRDVAILKVPFVAKPTLPVAAATLAQGESLYVLGSPRGLEFTLSDGIVSAIRNEGGLVFVQMTAPISPGNSGGPVFAKTGSLVAMAVSQVVDGQNLNFAIPIADVIVDRVKWKPRTLGETGADSEAATIKNRFEQIRLLINSGQMPLAVQRLQAWESENPGSYIKSQIARHYFRMDEFELAVHAFADVLPGPEHDYSQNTDGFISEVCSLKTYYAASLVLIGQQSKAPDVLDGLPSYTHIGIREAQIAAFIYAGYGGKKADAYLSWHAKNYTQQLASVQSIIDKSMRPSFAVWYSAALDRYRGQPGIQEVQLIEKKYNY